MALRVQLANDPYSYDDPNVELGGVRYIFQVRWNWRTGDWRLSVKNPADGSYVCKGRRISPGAHVAIFPDGGELHAFGNDPYERTDLGSSVYVLYYTAAEIEELAVANSLGSDPTFTLV